MMYQVLQWTPAFDVFEPLAEWQIQTAEYDLKLNKTHYYECAIRLGDDIFYPLEIAVRIVMYWEKRWGFAVYSIACVEL